MTKAAELCSAQLPVPVARDGSSAGAGRQPIGGQDQDGEGPIRGESGESGVRAAETVSTLQPSSVSSHHKFTDHTSDIVIMIPGLPPLPQHLGLAPQPHLWTLLQQQALLSRAQTSVANSFVTSASAPGFPFNPFLPLPPVTSSPELMLKTKYEEAEDLSSPASKRFKTEGGQAVCPICNISLKAEELPEHFQAELKCLDNIRSLSPIARPNSSNSSYRPFSSSPNKSSLSLSPTSPGHLESRWQRFERIRGKRRERIGAKSGEIVSPSHPIKQLAQMKTEAGQTQEADIDIGDSLSDSGSASDSESGAGQYGPLQYTEADVLRCLSEAEAETEARDESSESHDENANSRGACVCPACEARMVTPVLNVSCWHLKCEKCWLVAIGTKKVCTICAQPASVKDLRKVHL